MEIKEIIQNSFISGETKASLIKDSEFSNEYDIIRKLTTEEVGYILNN